jgi:hypothetical protein
MSRRIFCLSVVALVALTAVSVCIVFVVLRRTPRPPPEEEGEIPTLPADVSTISLPIKADYAALASEIRDAASKEITIPGAVDSGRYTIYDSWPSSLFFYYTADLLSLDVSLGDGSAFAASVEAVRRVLEQITKNVLGAKGPLAPIERLREQEISLAERPVLVITGEIHLHGPIQKKGFGRKFLFKAADYDGNFQFSKSYSVGLDKSAKLIFGDLGQADMEALERASLEVLGIPFKDWFGGLKKAIVPILGKKVDAALKKHVNVDYLTPFYDKGWNALHAPIKLANEVWLVFHPEELKVAQLCSSGTTPETTVTVLGRPKVVLGDKPQVPQVPPMPPVRLGEAKGGLHVVVDAIVPLDEAERLLNKELGGLEEVIYKQAKVKVPKARIYSRENWLRLELLLEKPFRGSVFLEGAPRYDAENNELYVEGLDFTVDTKNVLAKSASWLLERPLLKDYLQPKVRLPVGGPLAKVGKAIRKYKEEVPDYGVVFQGETPSFKMLGVYNTREAIHFIVQADGTAEVIMKPPAPNRPPNLVKITGI